MRFLFTVAPAAALIAATTPAAAKTFLSLEQAQQLIFPGARFTPADFVLSAEQAEALERASGATVYHRQVKLWKASTGGWFFLDQVPGRDDRITYAVGVNPDGTIKAVEVLVCLPDYDQVRGPWKRLFAGKRFGRAHLAQEIPNVSGATLSATHLTDGVTRVLATYALFVAAKPG